MAIPPPPPIEFRVVQRQAVVVPGTEGRYTLKLGDITHGQTWATITPTAGSDAALLATSVVSGGRYPITLRGSTCVLEVTALVNYLVGDDYGSFRVTCESRASAVVGPAGPALEPKPVTIDTLLLDLEKSGAVFLREGAEYDAVRAAAHLRQKWGSASQITEPEDFIERLASRSSTTGNVYRVRRTDGQVVDAGEFLRARLAALRAPR